MRDWLVSSEPTGPDLHEGLARELQPPGIRPRALQPSGSTSDRHELSVPRITISVWMSPNGLYERPALVVGASNHHLRMDEPEAPGEGGQYRLLSTPLTASG